MGASRLAVAIGLWRPVTNMFLFWIDRLLARWPSTLAHGLDTVTLRAVLAAATSFALAIAYGPRMIRWLQARYREPIKSGSAEVARLHQPKAATPTMGGLFVVGGMLTATLAFADLASPYVLLALLLVAALAVLGVCDDLLKLNTAARGMSARSKGLAQSGIALMAALLLHQLRAACPHGLELACGFGHTIDLGWWFVPLTALVLVSASNAVNLTDGLDGLAAGCLICATVAAGTVAYASGHAGWAQFLGIAHVAGAGEMAVIGAGMVGALLGFLWFNCHPASVFMGDTGSLPLGGMLGLMFVVARQELLLVVAAGVFVIEAASVIVQVASFRWRKRRVLLCAPLHHHFQLRGWPEDKIVVRFWIAGAVCAVAALAVLQCQAPGAAPRSPISTARHLPR
jgi:phospho-N-acetylmuramoyl-pentapeptide-transferase